MFMCIMIDLMQIDKLNVFIKLEMLLLTITTIANKM